jgi:hypothetical protein
MAKYSKQLAQINLQYCMIMLEKIFLFLDSIVSEYNENQSVEQVRRVVLAVSRQGMAEARGRNRTGIERLANENLDTLLARLSDSPNDTASIFECGERWIQQWYSSVKDKIEKNYYG